MRFLRRHWQWLFVVGLAAFGAWRLVVILSEGTRPW